MFGLNGFGVGGFSLASHGGAEQNRDSDDEANGRKVRIYARPHPGPLPRGEGEAVVAVKYLVRRNCRRSLAVFRFKARTIRQIVRSFRRLRAILPLLGERAGVRASVCHACLIPCYFSHNNGCVMAMLRFTSMSVGYGSLRHSSRYFG